MIRGNVFERQARVNVEFRLPGQPEFRIEYVLDTGFEGALTLPHEAVVALGLPYVTELTANLADNTSIRTDVYIGTIIWDGVELEVAVLVLEGRPLLGTALLDGHHLEVDFTDGGAVRIEAM